MWPFLPFIAFLLSTIKNATTTNIAHFYWLCSVIYQSIFTRSSHIFTHSYSLSRSILYLPNISNVEYPTFFFFFRHFSIVYFPHNVYLTKSKHLKRENKNRKSKKQNDKRRLDKNMLHKNLKLIGKQK